MLWIQRLWLRFQTLFRRNRNTRQLNDEIQFHLDQQVAENLAAGKLFPYPIEEEHPVTRLQSRQAPMIGCERGRGPTIQNLNRKPEPIRGSSTMGANPPPAWDQLKDH
jgi:hypothetical protein